MTAAPMSLDSQDELPLLLHVWSGPRSLSTAFMYSFSRHSRCTHCADEPLYAAYLQRNPHLYRPYRAELLQQAAAGLGGQHLPARAAMQRLLDVASAAGRGSFVYAKHIAKMYDDRDIPDELLLGTHAVRVRHVVLVRDPLDMVRSWTSRGVDGAHSLSAEDSCCLEATNLPQLAAVLSRLKRLAAAGSGGGCGCGGEALHRAGDVVVVDVDRLKQDPRGVLAALCGRLQLPFDEQMLHWPAGPKPQIDG